jgi:hypothetical protein
MTEYIYGKEPCLPSVVEVKPMPDFELWLKFDNDEERIFDAKPLLEMKVFKRLANEAFFRLVRVKYGSVEWPNDIDYCPDTLYMESVPVSALKLMT